MFTVFYDIYVRFSLLPALSSFGQWIWARRISKTHLQNTADAAAAAAAGMLRRQKQQQHTTNAKPKERWRASERAGSSRCVVCTRVR